jgi:hypothetical protein
VIFLWASPLGILYWKPSDQSKIVIPYTTINQLSYSGQSILTRTLQILFILTLVIILIFWVGDFFVGTPVDISDRASSEGWVGDRSRVEAEILNSRLRTFLYAIPILLLVITTIKSIRQKNELLFYWTFFIGLSIFQLLPLAGLLNSKVSDPSFLDYIVIALFFIFTLGQLFSVTWIRELRKSKQHPNLQNTHQ